MTHAKDKSGEATIANSPEVDKVAAAFKYRLAIIWRVTATGQTVMRMARSLGWLAVLSAAKASAVPVVVARQVPMAKNERYIIEVAKDSGFSQIVLTDTVKGGAYVWNTPGEGVFHWRLTRPVSSAVSKKAEQGVSSEASSFASGSFAAVEGSTTRTQTLRLTWPAMPRINRYKVTMLDRAGRSRSVVTSLPFYTIPANQSPLMLEMAPLGQDKPKQDFRFEPGLALEIGSSKNEGKVAPALVAAPVPLAKPAPSPLPQAAAEAPTKPGTILQTQASQEPKLEQAADSSTGSGSRRRHMVSVYAKQAQEIIRLQKLSVDWESNEFVGGWGANFWTNPVSGLIISGSADYHEHKGFAEQPELLPNQVIIFSEARYVADLMLGFDVLKAFGSEHHMLALSTGAAVSQLPSLTLQLDPSLLSFPADPSTKVETIRASFFGGGLDYGYLTQSFAVILGGKYFVDTDKNKLSEASLGLELYPTPRLGLQLTAYGRQLLYERCESDSASCLVQGASQTRAVEAGAQVGVGWVLF